MTKGKIVLVPFPFDDLTSSKLRPALCLSNPVGPHRHVVLAFITSRLPEPPLESDVTLSSDDKQFGLTGLRVTSTIRLHRLLTVTTSLIKRELGSLPPKLRKQVSRKACSLFR